MDSEGWMVILVLLAMLIIAGAIGFGIEMDRWEAKVKNSNFIEIDGRGYVCKEIRQETAR